MNLCKAALLAPILVLSIAGMACAQDPSHCPKGSASAVIRISKIKPSGSVEGFKKAYADHVKWYADHKLADRFALEPVLMYDPVHMSVSNIPDQMMTVHFNTQAPPPHNGDPTWDAYVAEYRANSDIATETLTCLPN